MERARQIVEGLWTVELWQGDRLIETFKARTQGSCRPVLRLITPTTTRQ